MENTGKRTSPVPVAAKDSGQTIPERDLALFFTRLTATVEGALGSEALAERLSQLRRPDRDGENNKNADNPAIERALRRFGFAFPSPSSAAFATDLARRTGETVSRPAKNILFLLELLALGDKQAGMASVCGPTPNCPACRLASECNYFNRPRKPEISRRTPADRLLDGQAVSVSDAELLAALFFGEKATGQEKAIPALFDRYGRLSAMFRADPREYSALRNVERGQAVRLAAAAALHRRTLAEIRDAKIVIGSASDMYHHYADWFRETEGSATLTVLLDTNNQVIRAILLAGGSSRANPADIARQALLDNAPRLAVLRNTAGPIAPPSLDEADFDRRLASICAIIGIRLVDHVIVGNNGYYSFAEAGTLAQG